MTDYQTAVSMSWRCDHVPRCSRAAQRWVHLIEVEALAARLTEAEAREARLRTLLDDARRENCGRDGGDVWLSTEELDAVIDGGTT